MRCNVGFGLARRHRDYDRRLHERVLRQDQRLVANCATEEARRLYSMHREVMRSLQAKKGFLRLKQSEHGILYANPELEHDVADLLLNHFRHRFPTLHIALEHRNKTHLAAPDGRTLILDEPVKEAVRKLEELLPKNPQMTETYDERIWRQYYDSQQILERKNIGLMDKMMPNKYRDQDAAETKVNEKNDILTNFMR